VLAGTIHDLANGLIVLVLILCFSFGEIGDGLWRSKFLHQDEIGDVFVLNAFDIVVPVFVHGHDIFRMVVFSREKR
jgi:hypothetical protein